MYYFSLLHFVVYIYMSCLYIRDWPHLWCAWEHFNRWVTNLSLGSESIEGFFTIRTYMMLFSKIIASIVLSLLVYNSTSLTSCQEKKQKKTVTHQFGRSTQRAQISRIQIKWEEDKKYEHYMVKTIMALNRF